MIARYLATGVLGAAVALAAVAVHRTTLLGLPVGLLLAAAASLAVGWWLRGTRTPRLAASYAAGWEVLFLLVLRGRPEGDFALASDLLGYGLIAVALAVLLLGISAMAARQDR